MYLGCQFLPQEGAALCKCALMWQHFYFLFYFKVCIWSLSLVGMLIGM